MSGIGRREFVTLFGSAAAAWPLAARAQQDRMRRIGVLMNLAADDPESPIRLAALLQGLQQLGWTVRQNIQIDYPWGAGNGDLRRKHAKEMAPLAPHVILAQSSPRGAPFLRATHTV